jgi:hypothetical protein
VPGYRHVVLLVVSYFVAAAIASALFLSGRVRPAAALSPTPTEVAA